MTDELPELDAIQGLVYDMNHMEQSNDNEITSELKEAIAHIKKAKAILGRMEGERTSRMEEECTKVKKVDWMVKMGGHR